MSGVTVTYAGSTIHTQDEDGSFTLNTSGKYMQDNVIIAADDDIGSLELTYGGNIIATLEAGETKTLLTAGKMMTSDIYSELIMGAASPTRMYMTLTSDLEVSLVLRLDVANITLTVDWGDGIIETYTSGKNGACTINAHTYSAAGDYVIELSCDTGHTIKCDGFGTNIFNAKVGADKTNTYPQLTAFEFGTYYTFQGGTGGDFGHCTSLSSITIPNRENVIPSSCFINCTGLSTVVLPSQLTSINSQAFYGCIALPDNLLIYANTLDYDAYGNCTQLRKVWIRESVQTISVHYDSKNKVYRSPFYNCSNSLVIYCEADEKPAGWSEYFNLYGSTTDTTLTVIWGQKTQPW